jgi:hypothetical protein
MTKTEKLVLLNEWKKRIEETEAMIKRVSDLMGLDPESPVLQAIWAIETDYTKSVAALVGDRYESLFWYWMENGMGRKSFDAGPKGKTRKIKTLKDLLWLIEVAA